MDYYVSLRRIVHELPYEYNGSNLRATAHGRVEVSHGIQLRPPSLLNQYRVSERYGNAIAGEVQISGK